MSAYTGAIKTSYSHFVAEELQKRHSFAENANITSQVIHKQQKTTTAT